MQPTTVQFFSMLLGQAPMLVVYLGALIASVVFWSRFRRPAVLVFLASLLLLLTTLAYSVVQSWMLGRQAAGAMTMAQVGQRLAMLSLVTSIIRAAAYALLVGAAFVARRSERVDSGFPMAGVASSPSPLRL